MFKTFDRWFGKTDPDFGPAEPSARIAASIPLNTSRSAEQARQHGIRLREYIRDLAGLPKSAANDTFEQMLHEYRCLFKHRHALRAGFGKMAGKRVLFVGQCYYNSWYLSRALQRKGWHAELLNWDSNPASQIYYHGQDYRITAERSEVDQAMAFFLNAIYNYDIYHFSNAHGICFSFLLQSELASHFGEHQEIYLLKDLGKKIVYTNNGCLDGVAQSSFALWGGDSVCSLCRWRNEPSVCSDARNLQWGRFRNIVADYQCLLGGNRIDFNDAPTVHEVPEFYCLSPEIWRPDLAIPEALRLPPLPPGGVRLYHGVGHRDERTDENGITIKSTHVYRPLVAKLQAEGLPVELMQPTHVPNLEVRFLQLQADVFLDMLSYGWIGATAREGMMLGKPIVAFIREEWLESLRQEIPAYADELPVVRATPETIEVVLRDLIAHPALRREIGARSRAFAMKWHSDTAGAQRFDQIYSRLLEGDLQLRGAKRK
jgi:glycosyltransferase involved in cell wall biosynthesis